MSNDKANLEWAVTWTGAAWSIHGPACCSPLARDFRKALAVAGARCIVDSGYLIGIKGN